MYQNSAWLKFMFESIWYFKSLQLKMSTLWAWQKKMLQQLFKCQTFQNSVVTNNTVGPSKFVHFNPNIFLACSGVTSFRLQSPIRRQSRGDENMASSYYWYPKCIYGLYEYLQHTSCSYKFHQHRNIAHAAYQKLWHRWDKGSVTCPTISLPSISVISVMFI
jgi:hypothetical protein